MVFDLTRSKTFESISNWYQDIKGTLKPKYGITGFLLGNKSDLVNKRSVNEEDAQKLAKELNLNYIETSALTGENVEDAFKKMADTILEVKKVMKMRRR